MNQPTCPTHGQQYYRFHEKYGAGCSFKGGVGAPGMNANGYCAWKPGKGNGAPRDQSQGAAPQDRPASRSYGKSPEETRSIQAQTAMKCAVELYGPAFSIAPREERDNLLAEMITSALRINQNIHRMSEPGPRLVASIPASTYQRNANPDEPPFPDDDDAQRWQS